MNVHFIQGFLVFVFLFLFLNNLLGFCSFPDIFFSSPISVYGPSLQKASINKGFLTYGLPSSSLATKKGFVGCSNAAGSRLAPLGLMSIADRLARDYFFFLYIYLSILIQQWQRGDKHGPAWLRGSRNSPWERRRGQRGRCPRGWSWSRRWLSGPSSARCFGCRGFTGSP